MRSILVLASIVCASVLLGVVNACSPATTLDLATLKSAMANDCSRCAEYLPHINTALQEFDMDCPLRIAAFLAQARHETAGFKTMYQSLDQGAGSIHMLPYNFREACRAIPALKSAFATEFSACPTKLSDPCACGSDAQAGLVVQQPDYTFRVGVWWFKQGSAAILTAPCGDLRSDADVGLGVAGSYTRGNPGTGFYKISTCIYGFVPGGDGGLAQRIRYYTAARRAFDSNYMCQQCAADEHEIVACSGEQERVCSRCPPCAAGTYEVAACTDTQDRQCAPCSGACGAGFYKSKECDTQGDRTCTACSTACPGGMYAYEACSADADMVCATCKWSCPWGQWKVKECATAHDVECAECSTCGDDEFVVSECTFNSDVVCGDAHAQCVAAPWELTQARLETVMGGASNCANCASLRPHIVTALSEGKMQCQMRTIAFLAQVRHETAGLTSFIQPLDNGAGAIHMLPTNFRLACADIASLKTAFGNAFGGSGGCDAAEPCGCGSDAEAAAIVARPEFAFRTGVWWFSKGSRSILKDPCSDLRQVADEGAGADVAWVSKWSPGSGYYKISTCIYGFGAADPGREQRMRYYLSAMRAFDADFACTDTCPDEQYLTQLCAPSKPTTCAACTKCWVGQEEASGCSDHSDRVCFVPGTSTTTTTTSTSGGSTSSGGGSTTQGNSDLYSAALPSHTVLASLACMVVALLVLGVLGVLGA